jgi:membrane associated rhomboid family serine protease
MLPLRDNIPTRRFPLVTVALIAVNIAVWLFYQLPDLERSVLQAGFFPCEVDGTCRAPGGSWETDAVTSMFMHGSWIHIAGNMLFLWIFGNNVEDAMGRVRYLVFYFLSGFAATALQTWITLRFGTPAEAQIPSVGASGAIAGVLGAYLLLYPRARVLTLVILVVVFLPVEIPALFYLGLWFVFQLWQAGFNLFAPSGGIGEGGVAFFAHVGGFVFGMLTVWLFTGGRMARRRAPAWPRAEL